jgi:hypothetical protein
MMNTEEGTSNDEGEESVVNKYPHRKFLCVYLVSLCLRG